MDWQKDVWRRYRLTGEGVGKGDKVSHALRWGKGAGVSLNHKNIVPALGYHLAACLITEALAQVYYIDGLEFVQRQEL